ncbi:MAG: N-acyl homoserine lactonase family protein [Myxococcota bacterium]
MLALVFALACTHPSPTAPPSGDGIWVLEMGRSTFPASHILQGAPETERWPFSWQAWLIHADRRWVLVDAGFREPDVARRRGIEGFTPIAGVLARRGLKPADISDLIITHSHWDHVGGAADFPEATLWIQADELAWMRSRVSTAHTQRSGLRLRDRNVLEAAAAQGRLQTPDGDAMVSPSIRLHRSGGHTPGVQWVEVHIDGHTTILASDIAYQTRNLTEGPPGGSRDAAADWSAIETMKALSTDIIPGHDPRSMQGPRAF